MSSKKTDFNQFGHDILSRMDLDREAESLGVRFSASGANAGGWRECYSIDREETKPSAAVNVANSNGSLGRYTDLAGKPDKSISFWDLCVRLGRFPDWLAAREHYANLTGVKLPAGQGDAGLNPAGLKIRKDKEGRLTNIYTLVWASKKIGVSADHAIRAGAKAADFCGMPVLAFTAYVPGHWSEPAGMVLYRMHGQQFPAGPDGKPPERKVHLVRGSKNGLIIAGSIEQFHSADAVWLCEGLPDALAAAPHLPAGHIAATTTHGAKKFGGAIAEGFRGKSLIIVRDADEAGEAAAAIVARHCLVVAAEVRICRLPYETTVSKGKDLRDYLNDKNSIEGLWQQVQESPALAPGDVPKTDDGKPELLADEWRTEVANGKRLARKFGKEFRWVEAWKKYLVWDGRRWAPDSSIAMHQFAKLAYADLWVELAKIPAAITGGDDDSDVKAIRKFIIQSGSARGIKAMLDLARSEEGIPVSAESLDARPMLFNLQNLTLDLEAQDTHPNRQDDLLTQLAPVAADFDASCPCWDKFIFDITAGDAELAGYIQRAVGMCLCGLVEEHALFFCYGDGSNGKSTFLNTILALMGDYGMKAAPELLMVRRHDPHPTERADLAGKRFVACIEADAGARIAESLVKELTGGDSIRARRMHQDHFEFRPTHKIWLAANNKPTIRGDDEGIWRRIKLIPFTVTFRNEQIDAGLPAKLLAELPGILNWAVLGFADWRQGGLREPAAVSAAVSEYKSDMDVLGHFIDECCEMAPDARVRANAIYKAFIEWIGNQSISSTRFGTLISKRFKKQVSNGVFYLGVELRIKISVRPSDGKALASGEIF